MQQVSPALQMFAAFGQMGAAPVAQAPLPAPVPTPVTVPQPQSQSRAVPSRDKSLAAKAFSEALLNYNQQVQGGDRVYVSADLMRRLLNVGIKFRKRAYDELKPHIQHQHDEFGLSHWANQDRDFSKLLAWLKLHYPDLPLRDAPLV